MSADDYRQQNLSHKKIRFNLEALAPQQRIRTHTDELWKRDRRHHDAICMASRSVGFLPERFERRHVNRQTFRAPSNSASLLRVLPPGTPRTMHRRHRSCSLVSQYDVARADRSAVATVPCAGVSLPFGARSVNPRLMFQVFKTNVLQRYDAFSSVKKTPSRRGVPGLQKRCCSWQSTFKGLP